MQEKEQFVFNLIQKSVSNESSPIQQKIKHYATHTDFMHTLFYGISHSRMLSLARYMITIHTGVEVNHAKQTAHVFKAKDKVFTFYKTSVHFEIDVRNFISNQQDTLMDLLQELAKTLNVSRNTFKIIIIRNADCLLKYVQHQLRQMMELFYGTCRLILITSNIDKIDPTIQSRTVCIRVAKEESELWCQLMGKLSDSDMQKSIFEQTWNLIKRKKMSLTSLRKMTRLIVLTQLNVTYIVQMMIDRMVQRVDVSILCSLMQMINYYMHLQYQETYSEIYLEMIVLSVHTCLHNKPLFDKIYRTISCDVF